MNIDEYLRLVAEQVADAMAKSDLLDIVRLLRLCADTCLEKAKEAEASLPSS